MLDLCFESDPSQAFSSSLAEQQPAADVISLRNMDNVTWPGRPILFRRSVYGSGRCHTLDILRCDQYSYRNCL